MCLGYQYQVSPRLHAEPYKQGLNRGRARWRWCAYWRRLYSTCPYMCPHVFLMCSLCVSCCAPNPIRERERERERDLLGNPIKQGIKPREGSVAVVHYCCRLHSAQGPIVATSLLPGVYIYMYVQICIHVCMNIYTCVCVCVCVCVCTYIYVGSP